jgi:DNA primase
MGTALTPEQAGRLRRLTQHAIVCYDGDTAGKHATRGALQLLLAQGFEAKVARLPEGEDPDDLLRREGMDAVARAIDQAPDYLTWLVGDVRPQEPGLPSAEKRERLGNVLEILAAIPDRILRYEEYRKVAREVSVPLDVLWSGDKANLSPENPRSTGVEQGPGTLGNGSVLSAGEIPQAERALLQVLIRGGELKPLITDGLRDEWVTHEGVRKLTKALRERDLGPEEVDFRRQIAHLREDGDLTLLSLVALEDGPEPTRQRAQQVLSALETGYLKRESAALQAAIGAAEAQQRSTTEIEELMRKKQDMDRRIAQLKQPSRKGNEVGD